MTTVDDKAAPSASPMDAVERHLDILCEVSYGFKARRVIHALAYICLRLRRTRVVFGDCPAADHDFVNMVCDAEDDGLISSEEVIELLALDLALTAQRPSDNASVYVAVEVSVTAGKIDIDRVARRARMLERAVNQPVIPLVVSANVGDAEMRWAEENGVTMAVQPEFGEG